MANSWQPHAKPMPPCQWLEEAMVEAFSIRGLRPPGGKLEAESAFCRRQRSLAMPSPTIARILSGNIRHSPTSKDCPAIPSDGSWTTAADRKAWAKCIRPGGFAEHPGRI